MSIVEKSLSKFRDKHPEPATVAKSAETAVDGTGQPAPHQVQFAERRRLPRRDPGQTRFFDTLGPRIISFEPTRLRELGLYAPVEFEAGIEDQFRRIKRPLLDAAIGRDAAATPRGRLILVTSSLANEGKTFCSVNLALTIARERDLSVVLIDGDVHKAHISECFGLENERGLVDVVTNPALTPKDVCLRTSVPQLYLLPAGQMTSDLPEQWASERMESIVEELALLDRQSIVIMDTSPILLTNETQVLSRLAGQVIFVVRADETPRSVIMEALALVDSAPRVSCLLNQSAEAAGDYYRYGRYPYGGTRPVVSQTSADNRAVNRK